jgi:sulfite exporter TauE/SafE
MAGGFVAGEAGKRAEFYEGRITSYFILACIVGSLGGSLFGYDLGVSSKLIQKYFLQNLSFISFNACIKYSCQIDFIWRM